MNQIEMNRIAINFIEHESYMISKKLETVLAEDAKEKFEEMPGMTVHHIHNMAIFNLLLMINCLFAQKGKSSEESAGAYCELGESLRPDFIKIVDSLKDFMADGDHDENVEDEDN